MSEPIRITKSDLHTPAVNEYVDLQAYLTRDVGPVSDQPWLIRVIYANWFYLSLAAMAGGIAGWLILEPFIDDQRMDDGIIGLFIFPTVAGFVGLFLGAAEGIMCRNPRRAFISGAVGLGVGFGGGLIAIIPTAMIFGLMTVFAVSLMDQPPQNPNDMPTGMALLVFMMGRAAAWSVAAIPAGIGQGIALREKKVVINGLVGALLGGLLGGFLFDPIDIFIDYLNDLRGKNVLGDGQAAWSRAVGFATIGLFVGLFVGLVEGWTKTAWLLMRKGPLAGKQFILFKDTTVLGSSPKADVYLFKDDAIEPRHALVTNRGGRFEIEDCNTPDGTYVNGIPITRHILQPGDQVVLGKTVLEFSVKESSS